MIVVCVASGGVPVPKPAFLVTFNQTGSLPTDVVSAVLVAGSISLTVNNNLGFDPINPATIPPEGTFTATLYDTDITGTQLGTVTLDGANGDAIPTGLSMIPIPVMADTVSSTIFAEVTLDSPAGDAVPIDLATGFTVTVGTVTVSSVEVNVDSRTVSETTDMDVADVGTDITDKIQEGSLILEIQNPFGVGVNMTFDVSPCATCSRAVNLSSAQSSSVELSYDGDEFRSFLGQSSAQFSASGTVLAPAPATVEATDVLVIGATLNLTLEIS